VRVHATVDGQMRRTSKAICVCALSIILQGCGNDLDCASSGTKDLIAQIAAEDSTLGYFLGWEFLAKEGLSEDQQAIKQMMTDIKKEMKYTLETIRMTAKDQTTGAVSCAADLRGDMGKYGAAKRPITYKVAKTSDGKLYVTLTSVMGIP